MAAFTGSPAGSVQYNKQVGVTQGGVYGGEVFADLHAARFRYTHPAAAGAGTGEINLIILPPGPLIIYSSLSSIDPSQFATSATLSIGHRANVDYAGGTIAAVTNAFLNAAAVGASDIARAAWTLPAIGFFDINNARDLTIFATVASGNIALDDTIDGWVVWAGGALG